MRPAHGLHPKYYKLILGKNFSVSKKKGSPLKLPDVNNPKSSKKSNNSKIIKCY